MEQTINLNITGMTCASCVNRIEKNLKKDTAIITAEVNLATESAQVKFDNSKIGEDGIIKIIEKAGYNSTLKVEGEADFKV